MSISTPPTLWILWQTQKPATGCVATLAPDDDAPRIDASDRSLKAVVSAVLLRVDCVLAAHFADVREQLRVIDTLSDAIAEIGDEVKAIPRPPP